jgi:hypothetical protein
MIDSLAEQAADTSFDFRHLFEGFEKVKTCFGIVEL